MSEPTKRLDTSAHPTRVLRTLTDAQFEPLRVDLDDAAQRLLGDYELLQKLGEGGMGVVYRALQRSLNREVALKLLATGICQAEEFVERFRREAQSAARLQHPNIVGVYEIGSVAGRVYFSMQLVEGSTLEQRLRAGPLQSVDEAAAIVRTLAETLHYAHELNVLHLDLKPANVLIAADGRPMIADFGLSRPLDHAMAYEIDEISGTPSYMAPEQIEIRRFRLSRATDLYALGAILFELLAGRPPIVGRDADDVMRRVVEEPAPALRRLRPGLSRDLEAIAAKCLAKDPAARYASARELAADLGRYLDGHPISIRRPPVVERLQRFAKQNPVSLGGLVSAFAVLLSLLLAFAALWAQMQIKKDAIQDLVRIQARHLGGPLADPDQRVRRVLVDAMDESFYDDWRGYGRQAFIDALHEGLDQPDSPERQRELALATALIAARDDFGPALARRPAPAAQVLAAWIELDKPQEREHAFAALARLGRAADAAPEDAAIQSAAMASWCRNDDAEIVTACGSERIRARLRALEPDNLFAWAVSAPLALDDDLDRERYAVEAATWATRATLSYRNHEAEFVDQALTEIDSAAAEIVIARGLSGVDPRDLATAWATETLQVGYYVPKQAAFAGLTDYCLGRSAVKTDAALCDRIETAIEQGADNPGERRFLAELRRMRRSEPKDAEAERVAEWQRRAINSVLYRETPFERDRRYLEQWRYHGLAAARADLVERYAITMQPPPGWKAPDR
jgi:hypothetical protein